SQRTSELGIRMALGASRESIVFMVLRQGLYLALGGTALGIAGALALTRLVSTLLYDTSPTDLFTFAATSLLFLAVAATACFVPGRQITAIDPLLALRQEEWGGMASCGRLATGFLDAPHRPIANRQQDAI